MNTIALVVALYESFTFLHALEGKILEQNPKQTYWKSVSLNHNTITLSLHTKIDTAQQNISQLYLKASFDIKDGSIVLEDMYCENNAIAEELRKYVLTYAPKQFDTSLVKMPAVFTEEVLAYLRSADEIAKQAYQCSSGDNYHPGYFSEIILEENQIILKQINRWNARSIDHKTDYHMRDLEFSIPLTSDAIEKSFMDGEIGRMTIHFSDHSSPNNKTCGDKIIEQIKIEKQKFGSGK